MTSKTLDLGHKAERSIMWAFALVALNLCVNCALHIALTLATRQTPSLPWRWISWLLFLVGYAHVVWLLRPRVSLAMIGFVIYALVLVVMNLIIGTSIIITMYGQ